MTGARPDTWMPVYIGDYLADTMHLSYAEHGAYLLLIFAYWRGGEPLQDDDRLLAGICKASAKQWRDLRPTLARFFYVEDGLWRHKRVDDELVRATAGYAKRSAAAMKRWGNASSKADAMHEQPQPQPHSNPRGLENGAPSAPTKERANAKPKRRTRIDPAWQPSAQTREFARGLSVDPDQQLPEFRDYWVGDGGAKVDWDATFRNHCRRAAERRSRGGSKASGLTGFAALLFDEAGQGGGGRGLGEAPVIDERGDPVGEGEGWPRRGAA